MVAITEALLGGIILEFTSFPKCGHVYLDGSCMVKVAEATYTAHSSCLMHLYHLVQPYSGMQGPGLHI